MKFFLPAVLLFFACTGGAVACDLEADMQTFSFLLRKTAEESPGTLARIRPELNRAAGELEALLSAGIADDKAEDAICARVGEMIALFTDLPEDALPNAPQADEENPEGGALSSGSAPVPVPAPPRGQ